MSVHRVTITGTYVELGIQMQNVMHINNLDGLVSQEAIADDFIADWIMTMRQFQNLGFRYDTVAVRNLSNPGQVPYTATVSPAITGVSGSNILHPCVGIVLRLRSQVIGRRGRGRIYIMCTHSTAITRTRPSTTGFNLFNSLKPAFMRYISGGGGNKGFHLVIAPKVDPEDFVTITDILIAPVCGIQRRRNELVGM